MTNDRGQTTLDFAIGISLFVVVMLFVFLFVPNLFHPFNSGSQEETAAVSRVADELSQRMLGSIDDPYILNSTCTVRFFDNEPAGTCNFDGTTVDEQFNLELRNHVNVTVTSPEHINITSPDDIRCWDDSKNAVTSKSDCSASGADVALQTGDPLPVGTSSAISARRVVMLDGQLVSIKVVMW